MLSVVTYSGIVVLFFLQLLGIVCSFPITEPTDDLGEMLFLVVKYVRIIPILGTVDYKYTSSIALGVFLLFDVIFLIFIQ